MRTTHITRSLILCAVLLPMSGAAVAQNVEAILPPLPSEAAKGAPPAKLVTPASAKGAPTQSNLDVTGSQDATRRTLDDPAFHETRELLQPISPAQVQELIKDEEEIIKATEARPPPASATTSIPVTSRPGAVPKRILLSDDYMTALSFVDKTGSPWPVTDARLGNQELFEIEKPAEPGNIVLLAPKKRYAATNLIVLLQGSSAPIALSLETNREASYYSANLIVDANGPNAPAPATVLPPEPVDERIMRQIADGFGALVPDARAVSLKGDPGSSAFVFQNRFFLRTPHRLVDPAPSAGFRSGSIGVYEIAATNIITVVNDSGRTLEITPQEGVLLDAAFGLTNQESRP